MVCAVLCAQSLQDEKDSSLVHFCLPGTARSVCRSMPSFYFFLTHVCTDRWCSDKDFAVLKHTVSYLPKIMQARILTRMT